MYVVEHCLANIDDSLHLATQMQINPALPALVAAYNQYALNTTRSLYAATGETYGFDLKRYIGFLPATEQLNLMRDYLHECKTRGIYTKLPPGAPLAVEPAPTSDEEEVEVEEVVLHNRRESDRVKDERRLRHWLIKMVTSVCLVLCCVILGSVFAIMAHNKTLPDSALIKTIVETATAIFKVLFGPIK